MVETGEGGGDGIAEKNRASVRVENGVSGCDVFRSKNLHVAIIYTEGFDEDQDI